MAYDRRPQEVTTLDLLTERFQEHRVLHPVGELDAFTVGHFRTAVDGMTGGRFVMNLSDVPFMDSAGLGAVIAAIRLTRERGGQVAIACSRPSLLRPFRTTGTDRIATITASVEQAAETLDQVGAPSGMTRG